MTMHSLDDFQYAMENTRVIVPPRKRLETFATTVLNYHLITEDMDSAHESIVREGTILTAKPEILSPSYFSKLLLDGFGERAEQFAEAINQIGDQFAILKYGFEVQKSEIRTYEVHEPLEAVVENVKNEVLPKDDSLAVILTGVDDAWEVCLLKFMLDFINASGSGNIQDFRKKGLL